MSPSIGSNVNNGNGGATYLDLRGLGANRNLVLLNGTRVVPQGLNGLTNIDVIPVALLERMDVPPAVPVRFTVRMPFRASSTSSPRRTSKASISRLPTRSPKKVTAVRCAPISSSAAISPTASAVFAVGYTDRDSVFQGDRAYGVDNISSFSGNAGGSSTTVPSVIVPHQQRHPADRRRSLRPFYAPFNFNPYNIYQTPLKQYRLYGASRYEVNDAIEVFAEGMFVQSTTSTIIAPSGTFRNILETPPSNPHLTDGIRNQICGFDTDSDAAGVQRLFSQAECDVAATATDPNSADYRTVDLDFGRRFVEFGPRLNDYRTRLFQVKAGARGALTENLDWEVFGAYGESENVSRQSGNGTLSRLQQSVLSTSTDECLDSSNGCVPINPFGPSAA